MALTVVLLAVGLCQCAFASSQRGHSLVGSFGSPGSGNGELERPAGVAVDEATGDVYVVDAGNNRIDVFDAEGQFVEAWGWGVLDGAHQYERCTTECKAGVAGNGKYEFNEPRGIAIDNSGSSSDPSAGDVYVEARTVEEHEVVDKFKPEGSPIDVLHGAAGGEFEELNGLAVAPSGSLWIYDGEELFVYGDAEQNKLCPAPGKAFAPPCAGFAEVEAEVEGNPLYGLALDAKGDLYLGHEGLGGPEVHDTVAKELLIPSGEGGEPVVEPILQEIDMQDTTAVAADPATGDVYVQDATGLAAFGEQGESLQRFGESGGGGSGLAVVSSQSTTDAARAGYLYASDATADRISIYAPEAPSKPSIDSVSAQDVTSDAVQLDAQLDPDGAATRYYFEYGDAACGAEPGSCTPVPAPPGEELAAGCPAAEEFACFFEASPSEKIGGLSPGVTYHYRLTASNAQGTTTSVEGTFTTSLASGRDTADGRDLEMVSPADMDGGEAEPISEDSGLIQSSVSGQAITWVSTAPLKGAEGSRSLEATQLLSVRGPDGWETQDIVTPNEHGIGLILGYQEYKSFSSSLALSLVEPISADGVGSKLAEPPLSPPAPGEEGHQEKTPYLRRDAPVAPSSSEATDYRLAEADGQTMSNAGFLALVMQGNVLAGTEFGHALEAIDATPDLQHVVIKSEVPLTEGSAKAGSNLYLWSEGHLQLVNVLPGDGGPAVDAELGDASKMVRNALSEDGSRVVWVDRLRHLYVRDMARGETIRLDGTSEEEGHAIFQGASADDSTIFFTDEEPLTGDSTARLGRPDLFACELVVVAEHLRCLLTDLSPSFSTESADVQGLMVGSSADGSTVYYVANGALTNNSSPGQCRVVERQANAFCNLYVIKRQEGVWGRPHLVARLSNLDLPDWAPSLPDLGEVTSRVSPDGRYLTFMSQQSLTGYDNRDASPAAHEARDEEVYLYDSQSGSLTCVSCDPSGARPHGVLDPPVTELENEEGWGILVDRLKLWSDRWLAGSVPGGTKFERYGDLYQSRYLSDSGRVYFDSPADLVPEAVNGKEDVYEYEPLGVPRGAEECNSSRATYQPSMHGCLGLVSSGTSPHEAAFVDAGQSGGEAGGSQEEQEGGGDVFFVMAGLAPAEKGASYALYDAHECTAASPCLSAHETVEQPPCTSAEECRPLAYVAPATPSIATTAPAPKGEVLHSKTTRPAPKPTRAQLLAAALKSCRRRFHPGGKRHACETSARRRYGPKAKKPKGRRR